MIYLDVASIHNEMLKRHPEIDPNRSVCYHNSASTGPFATVSDYTDVPDGVEVELDPTKERTENYFGFEVRICKWRVKEMKTFLEAE